MKISCVQNKMTMGMYLPVPHEGVWYEHLAEAEAIKRALEQRPHKQDYWIEDEQGRLVPPSIPD